jgi:hypothetical protein
MPGIEPRISTREFFVAIGGKLVALCSNRYAALRFEIGWTGRCGTPL